MEKSKSMPDVDDYEKEAGRAKTTREFLGLLEIEETRGWSSTESGSSDIENSESTEAPKIRSHFLPAESGDVSSNEEAINERPFDMNLSNVELERSVVDDSHDLY